MYEAQKTTTNSANLMTSKQTKGAVSSTSGSKKTRCKHYWNKAKCWVCNPCSKCKEQGLEGSDTHHHSDKCTGKTEANLIEELLLTGVDDTSGSGPRTVSFAIDSGCTTHMVGNKGMVKPYSDHPILHKIRTAEAGRSITATARGSIEHSAGTLEKVLVVDEISRNLLSVSTLADEGHSILFRKNTCHIFNSDNQPVMKGYRKGGLYIIDIRVKGTSESKNSRITAAKQALKASIPTVIDNDCYVAQDLDTWHRRFNHLN